LPPNYLTDLRGPQVEDLIQQKAAENNRKVKGLEEKRRGEGSRHFEKKRGRQPRKGVVAIKKVVQAGGG